MTGQVGLAQRAAFSIRAALSWHAGPGLVGSEQGRASAWPRQWASLRRRGLSSYELFTHVYIDRPHETIQFYKIESRDCSQVTKQLKVPWGMR
jgi:hypothetical protein